MRTLAVLPAAILAAACSQAGSDEVILQASTVALAPAVDGPTTAPAGVRNTLALPIDLDPNDPLACGPEGFGALECGDPADIDPARHFGKHPGLRAGEVPVDCGLHHCGFCEEVGHDDDCAGATRDVNWYGLWEDAVAEAERTGKPLLIHMGSPRHIRVPGVW